MVHPLRNEIGSGRQMLDLEKDQLVHLLRGGRDAISEWNDTRDAGDNRMYLAGANLSFARLEDVDLGSTDLSNADLSYATLRGANLGGTNLIGARLRSADLSGANLRNANLGDADLNSANLHGARLEGTDLNCAYLRGTFLADVDLSDSIGVNEVIHRGPSLVDSATLHRCGWKLPEKFLRGCGFAPWEVTHARMYDPAITPAQFAELQAEAFVQRMTGPLFLGGIFISYSQDNSKFVEKLYKRLQSDGANVWLDRHDMLAGDLEKQVGRAVRLNDIVLLVLSESSVESDWVEHELEQARQKEKQESRDVLCPVALDDAWKEKTTGDVLWRQLKEKNILDFSNWKTKAFEEPFAKLVKGIKVNYPRPTATGDA